MIAIPPAIVAAPAAPEAPPPPDCRAGDLALAIVGRGGDFDGMSHGGTLVLLRNRGRACRIAALPAIGFADARDRVLPIARAVPLGPPPGPAMVPLTVPAGGLVSTPLRWVSGDVFDRGRCLAPARLTVTIGGGRLAVAVAARMCGVAGAPARFEQPPLRPGTVTAAP